MSRPKDMDCKAVYKRVKKLAPPQYDHDVRLDCIAARICEDGGAHWFLDPTKTKPADQAVIMNWYNRVCGRPVQDDTSAYYSTGAAVFGVLFLVVIVVMIVWCTAKG